LSEPRPIATRTTIGASERRPLTVLFADIVGSTAIAERMDPEDWTAIVSQAFARINATVTRYDGTIARLMGDGVLAFFGAPVAHEDDPIRAVRCGLDMARAVDELSAELNAKDPIDLKVRVGINTGPVVVGVVGTESASEYTAMGDAVNVAARMQALARPGTVLISGSTHRFVAALVESVDVGALDLKGKTNAVQAYEVTGLKEGATGRGLGGIHAPMIGREAPLARLRELFAVAKAGQGRVAAILGEPGIGKSRLLAEFRADVERGDESVRWVEGRCLSYGQTLPYHLVLDVVRSAIGVSGSASEPEVREALERLDPLWEELFPAEQARPQFDGTSQVRFVRPVGRQIAERRIRQHCGLITRMIQISHQRTMPIDLVPSNAHRRKLETIAEQAALMHTLRCLLNLFAAGAGAIEQQMMIARITDRFLKQRVIRKTSAPAIVPDFARRSVVGECRVAK